MARKDHRPLLVLHIEDDDNDATLLAMAVETASVPVELHRVIDGAEGMSYLLGEGTYADRFKNPWPQIVILDLKMPKMDGFEFLKWLREDSGLPRVPVLVFTSSASTEDKARALSFGASSYFVKPTSFDTLLEMVQFLKRPEAEN